MLEYVVENDLNIAISTGERESKSAICLVERMRPDNRSFHRAQRLFKQTRFDINDRSQTLESLLESDCFLAGPGIQPTRRLYLDDNYLHRQHDRAPQRDCDTHVDLDEFVGHDFIHYYVQLIIQTL
jgi:hypothetical protein